LPVRELGIDAVEQMKISLQRVIAEEIMVSDVGLRKDVGKPVDGPDSIVTEDELSIRA
jgi:hypothetical protein